MNFKRTAIVAVALLVSLSSAQSRPEKVAGDLPRVFSIDAAQIKTLRDRVAAGQFADPAIDKLRADAEKELRQQPVSVTMKNRVPPSGDKRDYMSLSRYWWPDPTKPGGLPYIRRDGESNPEIKTFPDHELAVHMTRATSRLALAYYILGDEKYAAHATKLLRTWFLDPATRMNPNLNYAQAVRGRNEGKGGGCIDTREFSRVPDTVGMLHGSKSWTAADQQAMVEWFQQYVKWLTTSKNGRDESRSENNHGSYYEAQVAAGSLFIGDEERAKKILRNETNRISWQIEKNGGQPLELERTKAMSYSTFNLTALFQLAYLGENVGLELWNFKTKDGAGIQKALDFMTPYVTGEAKWPYKQIEPYDKTDIAPLYAIAAVKYRNKQYAEIARKLDPKIDSDIHVKVATFGRE